MKNIIFIFNKSLETTTSMSTEHTYPEMIVQQILTPCTTFSCIYGNSTTIKYSPHKGKDSSQKLLLVKIQVSDQARDKV